MFELSKDGAFKVLKGTTELYPRDISESLKSCIPGEWVLLKNTRKEKHFLCFVNPLAIDAPIAHLLQEYNKDLGETDLDILLSLLKASITKRSFYKGYEDCSRLVYGNADYLPGLIVDSYINAILVQINTAGIDRFRNEIKQFFKQTFPDKEIVLFDNQAYRERESLPIYPQENLDADLKIIENDLNIKVKKDIFQKVGYYYDHRENRKRMRELLKSLNCSFTEGLDLFSYVGSWGLHMLQSGVEKVTFVDQGAMDESVRINLSLNDFDDRGSFVKANVFDFLKEEVKLDKKYKIICSDPPAFCKSKKEERKAYEGYLKLHKTIFDLLEKDSIFIACSCTYYVNHEQFQKNVEEAAILKGRSIQLLDCGVQGFDHPTKNLNSKNSYLKYYAYRVE